MLLTLYGLGSILGAGIYVVIGEVAGAAGLLTPFAFILAALVASLTALSFSELTARIPEAGGPIDYARQAFGRRGLCIAIGWGLVATGTVSGATILTGFERYASLFIDLPRTWTLIIVTLALGGIAIAGMRESAWFMAATTLLGMAGLGYVVWVAVPAMGDAPVRLAESLSGLEFGMITGLFLGAFLAFYSFIGFEDMANLAEEVHDAKRTMPRAIVSAVVISLVVYALVAIAATSVLSPDDLSQAHAPLVAVVEAQGHPGVPLGLISLFIIVNGALGQIIMATRLLMDMGRDQAGAPQALGRINPRTHTPIVATVAVSATVLVLALFLPLATLANLTSAIMLAVFITVNASLIVLKRRGQPEDVPNVPRWIPWAGLLLSTGALITQGIFAATGSLGG
ncbi:amino acid permease [Guyparkeria halopsychrophila]|uniref:APC family permease n=1 Tax=Guyparkeria halopsychrophila TaxID=3139421 RepID=UPI0037C74010